MTYRAISYDSYLEHHGIKGMKWGVRKKYEAARNGFRNAGSSAVNGYINFRNSRRSAAQQKALRKQEARNLRRRKPSEMTDAELDAEIGRLQKEKQLKNLRKDTQGEGRKFVSGVANRSFANIATQAMTFGLGLALNYVAIRSAMKIAKSKGKTLPDGFDNLFTGGIVNPRKGQKDKK